MAYLEQTIDWANYADSSEKLDFLKNFFSMLGQKELDATKAILNRRRKRAFHKDVDEPVRPWKGPRIFTGGRAPSVRHPSDDVEPPTNSPSLVATPPGGLPHPVEDDSKIFIGPWNETIQREDLIAFDVEAAQRYNRFLKDGNMHAPKDIAVPTGAVLMEKEPQSPKAAYLGVVNDQLKIMMEEKIQHHPGTYRVDYFTRIVSNITSTQQLKDGRPFHDVVSQFHRLTKNKLHITCSGGNDYRFLELAPSEYKSFDLQSYYMRPSQHILGTMEPMALRDIYFYHFREDMQRGPHSALTDAKATMKIFVEGYSKIKYDYEIDFSGTENLKKLAAKNLYWCKVKKAFTPRCSCVGCDTISL